jgi:hypothetical protein
MPIANVTSAAKALSKAIQASLKETLRFYYLNDIRKLHDLATSAALLVWTAMPPANDVRVNGNTVTFDVGNDVFWDEQDAATRNAIAGSQATVTNLAAILPSLRLRLDQEGMHGDVQFYTTGQVPVLIGQATSMPGSQLLLGLVVFEASIVRKAAQALADVQAFVAAAGTSPSQAITRLAEFAADITTAFNKLMGNTAFAGVSFRAVSQAVFAEGSRALDPALSGQARALLALSVLNPATQGTFTRQRFLDGEIPPEAAVAVAERLVSA